MSVRHWFRERMLGGDEAGRDAPPGSSLVESLLGRGEQRVRSLGEYDADSYPADLRERLTRREEVARKLLAMDITLPAARVEGIPDLRELLRTYPHPLAYETLIHAYLDAGRFDEAKGVAFAARQRRLECERAEHPEIRSEVEHFREWTPEEIDRVRAERETGGGD